MTTLLLAPLVFLIVSYLLPPRLFVAADSKQVQTLTRAGRSGKVELGKLLLALASVVILGS
jgi:hypothetical protein